MNFSIPLTFKFSTQLRNLEVKSKINTLLDLADVERLFFYYAQKKPHVFMVSKYVTNYLQNSDGFCHILEFGIDIVKSLIISKCFSEKTLCVCDSNIKVVERTKKYMSYASNINVRLLDVLNDELGSLCGEYDSLFFVQMDSYFSNDELQKICKRIYSVGIKDILIVSPSVVDVKSIISIYVALKGHFSFDSENVRYKRNTTAICNCFADHYKLFFLKKFHIYDMPYCLLHLKVK